MIVLITPYMHSAVTNLHVPVNVQVMLTLARNIGIRELCCYGIP